MTAVMTAQTFAPGDAVEVQLDDGGRWQPGTFRGTTREQGWIDVVVRHHVQAWRGYTFRVSDTCIRPV